MRVAVVGATGAVGSKMIQVMEERDFPVTELVCLATSRSAGSEVLFKGNPHKVLDTADFDFSGIELAFFAGGSKASKILVDKAREAGAVVVDNSSLFRMNPEVPLVIPEVNGEQAENHQGLIANPNCGAAQLLMAVAPLYELGLKRVTVSTYQSVSGSGNPGLIELERQVQCWAYDKPIPEPEVYSRQILFNVIPHIGDFEETGLTGEEQKLAQEIKKILDDKALKVHATCVRVPTRRAHSESVWLEFSEPVTREQIVTQLKNRPGLTVCDNDSDFPTCFDAEGNDETYVGRIIVEPDDPCCVRLWVVADNLRKGAATNAIQIGELLLKRGWL